VKDADRQLLDDQVAYYRARAGEYDATTTPDGDPFAVHADAVRHALRAFAPRGRALEIAAGTGQWTATLAEFADELVVTDASPEMLERNRARLGDLPNVTWRTADAFSLPATRDYDVAFLGFFLSHVPRGQFARIWRGLGRVVRADGGRVFVTDEVDHGLWDEDWVDRGAGIVRRRLLDGSVHRAVKVLWKPAELERRLRELGWEASVHAEGPFYWAAARPAPREPGA